MRERKRAPEIREQFIANHEPETEESAPSPAPPNLNRQGPVASKALRTQFAGMKFEFTICVVALYRKPLQCTPTRRNTSCISIGLNSTWNA